MNNELPIRIVIENFSDLKHKVNNMWSYVFLTISYLLMLPFV